MKKYRIPDRECKIAMKTGVLDMLAVIPQAKVKKQGITWVKGKISSLCAAKNIALSEPKWGQFWRYFHRTWIVRFPPNLWNVQPFSKELVSRTNNPLERFNRELNAVFRGSHPSLPEFVSGIKSWRASTLTSRMTWNSEEHPLPDAPRLRYPRQLCFLMMTRARTKR